MILSHTQHLQLLTWYNYSISRLARRTARVRHGKSTGVACFCAFNSAVNTQSTERKCSKNKANLFVRTALRITHQGCFQIPIPPEPPLPSRQVAPRVDAVGPWFDSRLPRVIPAECIELDPVAEEKRGREGVCELERARSVNDRIQICNVRNCRACGWCDLFNLPIAHATAQYAHTVALQYSVDFVDVIDGAWKYPRRTFR